MFEIMKKKALLRKYGFRKLSKAERKHMKYLLETNKDYIFMRNGYLFSLEYIRETARCELESALEAKFK